jgi:hypothetical protein
MVRGAAGLAVVGPIVFNRSGDSACGRGSVSDYKHAVPVTEPRPQGSGHRELNFPGTIKNPRAPATAPPAP